MPSEGPRSPFRPTVDLRLTAYPIPRHLYMILLMPIGGCTRYSVASFIHRTNMQFRPSHLPRIPILHVCRLVWDFLVHEGEPRRRSRSSCCASARQLNASRDPGGGMCTGRVHARRGLSVCSQPGRHGLRHRPLPHAADPSHALSHTYGIGGPIRTCAYQGAGLLTSE